MAIGPLMADVLQASATAVVGSVPASTTCAIALPKFAQ